MNDKIIEDIQNIKDIESFKRYVSSLDDLNKYLIKTKTDSLNLLHICIGFEESDLNLECIQYLLSVPDININALAKIEGNLGISGAHIAVDWKHYRALNALIDSGIDLFICDSYAKDVDDYAIERGDQTARDMIKTAVDNHLRSKFYSFGVIDEKDFIKSKTELNYSLNQRNPLLKTRPKSPKETDLEKTIEYFDEIWETVDNKSENSCGSEKSCDSLISNISYQKTESVKSFCEKTEIYIYNDRDHNVVLIEERFEGCVDKHLSDQTLSDRHIISKGSVTQTIADQHLEEIQLMNGTQIFNELRAMGDSPGPISPDLRKHYQKRLLNYRLGKHSAAKKVIPLPNHSPELNLLLEGRFPLEEALKLEKQFIDYFDKNNCIKNYFIYLLREPNITAMDNKTKIVVNSCEQIDTNLFTKFIKSIFYVGKGQGNRVYEHFYEAAKSDNCKKLSPKVKHILEIWSSNKGVTSVHCFNGISSEEALAREAIIIETIGLSNLCNKIRGHSFRALKWNERKRRLFGTFLLFKAFGVLIVTGERQIRRPPNH